MMILRASFANSAPFLLIRREIIRAQILIPCDATHSDQTCHCWSMVHVFECNKFNSVVRERKVAELPTFLRPETCHQGPCPQPINVEEVGNAGNIFNTKSSFK